MMFEEAAKAFKLIEKFAPILAEVLISPAAGVGTSFIINLLHNAFEANPKDMSDLAKKILSDPEVAEKLKELNKSIKLDFPDKSCDKEEVKHV